MSSSDDKEKFNDIVDNFSTRKLEYNYSELQRIKDRSHQIVAFFLVILSILSASLTSLPIEKLFANHLILGLLVTGFGLSILTVALNFKIMIGKHKNFIIDPKSLHEHYQDKPLAETREVIRDSLFEIMDIMDKRNEKLHDRMFKLYGLAVCSLIIIFIPMIWLLFNK